MQSSNMSRDNLVLDAETLRATADIINNYAERQKETIDRFFCNVNSLGNEWQDDETFYSLIQEIAKLKSDICVKMDAVNACANVFRQRAEVIEQRPKFEQSGSDISFFASTDVQNTKDNSTHIQQHKKEDTYQTSNGFSVTYLSSSSDSKNGKKYTDGVVIEGQLTFTYDHQKHTVSLNRKVHQYAAGIDLNYKRSNGQTNYEAMLEGKSPIVLIQTPDGIKKTRLDLHHLTQQEVIGFPDAPYSQGTLAEVPVASHQKYTKIIHMRYPREKGINTSFRVDKLPNHKYKLSKDEAQFNEFRKQYWKARAQMLKEFNR